MIALYHGKSWVSRMIQWQTRSYYSHAAWVLPGRSVIEAWHIGGVAVNITPAACHTPGTTYDLFDVEGLTPADRRTIEEFLLREVGKGYDFRSVFRFLSREAEDLEDKDKWFCSELVFAACESAGIRLLDRIEAHEVSPALLSFSPRLKFICRSRPPDVELEPVPHFHSVYEH